MDVYAHSAELVRETDKDRYLADLFAPEPARRHLFALHAFNSEIAGVRDKVSEPLAGEVRLQWWRDALASGETGGHPVATALLATMRTYRLPVQAFDRMIETRIFDLYDDPMPSVAALEGYAGDTAAALFQLAAIVLNDGEAADTANVAGQAGVAWVIAGALRSLPVHAARRQVFLPADRIAALGGKIDDYYARRPAPQLGAVITEMIGLVRRHLAEALAGIDDLPQQVLPAFLPLALIEPGLQRAQNAGATILNRVTEVPQWRKQLALWGFARRLSRRSGRGDSPGRR